MAIDELKLYTACRDMLPTPQPLQWRPSPEPSPQRGEQVMMDLSPDTRGPASRSTTAAQRMSPQASVQEARKGGLYTDSGGASTGSDTTPHAQPHRAQHEQQASEGALIRARKQGEVGTDAWTDRNVLDFVTMTKWLCLE